MSESNKIVKAILQKFTNELKNQESLSYAGHNNLWVDLGWDISQGDGEICNHVEDMLRIIVDSLPEQVKELIWSESWGGKAKMQDILDEINKSNGDLTTIAKSESLEITGDIVEYLKDGLFLSATAAYDQYQDMDIEEDAEESSDEDYQNDDDEDDHDD
jgi:hypothetical protein